VAGGSIVDDMVVRLVVGVATAVLDVTEDWSIVELARIDALSTLQRVTVLVDERVDATSTAPVSGSTKYRIPVVQFQAPP
jgi:hypothetical protein